MRSALIVNLLTEDNLPYYFRSIESMFGDRRRVGHLGPALDGRGGPPLDGDLRLPDVHAGGRPGGSSSAARMAQVSGGKTPDPDTDVEGFVYLTLQELATRIAHRNTGKLVGDPVGYDVMIRVAADENLHHLFYRDLATAAIAMDPNVMLPAIEKQVVGFAMPGLGIPGFAQHAAAIARAGVYDLAIHHDQILVPMLLRHWQIDQLEGLDAEAEQAHDRLMARLAKSERVARRLTERREAAAAAAGELVGV